MEPITAAAVERRSIAVLATKFDIVAQDNSQGRLATVEK
jgi:hypothetical protein